MLINFGNLLDNLKQGDSIRNTINEKYDIILANPPFGIKGLMYNEILDSKRNEYLPIKSNSAVSLFIQAIIYILKVNGRCAVVLPDGKELFSKTDKSLIAIREYLMKTCDLKEVIYLPSGVFTHTSIKTCVFYFVKKRECNEVLTTKVKYSSKTQKETGRTYKFTKTFQTKNVKFYDYNPYNEVKFLLEVSIKKIEDNHYSLNYMEYLEDEINEEHFSENITFKYFKDIAKYLNKVKEKHHMERIKDYIPLPLHNVKLCDTNDYIDESIIIGTEDMQI